MKGFFLVNRLIVTELDEFVEQVMTLTYDKADFVPPR